MDARAKHHAHRHTEPVPRTPDNPHWYFTTRTECPVCGYSTTDRERRYGERPERWEDRNRFEEQWCGRECQG